MACCPKIVNLGIRRFLSGIFYGDLLPGQGQLSGLVDTDQPFAWRIVLGRWRWRGLDGEDSIAGYIRDHLVGIVAAWQEVLAHKVPLHQTIGALVPSVVIALDYHVVVVGLHHDLVRMELPHINVDAEALLIHMHPLAGVVVVPPHRV